MEAESVITLDLSSAVAGCRRVQRRLESIANIMDHAEDLMEHWRKLMEQGNLDGVLAGTDGDGNPMTLVTYRPRNPRKMSLGERLGQRTNKKRGRFAGPAHTRSSESYRTTTCRHQRTGGSPARPWHHGDNSAGL